MEVKHPFPLQLSLDNITKEFGVQAKNKFSQWREKLSQNPESFKDIEKEIEGFGKNFQGMFTILLLEDKQVDKGIQKEARKIRSETLQPVKNSYRRFRKVQILSGHKIGLKTLYCGPNKNDKKIGDLKSESNQNGLGMYPELAALGIHEGYSPGIQSEVGWIGSQLSSISQVEKHFKRNHCRLTNRGVRTIFLLLANMALNARREGVMKWRDGSLEPSNELVGKRVAVAIDGGRVRIRERKKGKKSKKGYPRYIGAWREPKLFIIYQLDESGKINKAMPRVVDGSLLGPDFTMELLAYHLYRLGASQAQEIIFLGDGQDWIWDRLPNVIIKAKLPEQKVFLLLDFYHAAQNISQALETIKEWDKKMKKKEFKELRSILKKGQLEEFFRRLNELKKIGGKEFKKKIKYFEKRKIFLNYGKARRRKLPLGSGAIESTIRRVINLKIKGPGIFWTPVMAEGMIVIRANCLINRWEELMKTIYQDGRKTRRRSYKFAPIPMSAKKARSA